MSTPIRLLRVVAGDSFEFETFAKGKEPRYAILSHTWGKGKDDEVLHEDVGTGEERGKPGYKKMQFCARQAKADGLDHFWIDTCCIDRRNHVELSAAINAMFRWYKSAAKCYVYLSDVEVSAARPQSNQGTIAQAEWETAFRNSRWFSRGWTLQELIAPESVVFYAANGLRLGDKSSLKHAIHDCTTISLDVLEGGALDSCTSQEIFSWAERRTTTLEEDVVYCLLGLFGVTMIIHYEEGLDKARRRLMDEIREHKYHLPKATRPYTVPFAVEPPMKTFVDRPIEMGKIEQELLPSRSRRERERRRVYVLSGMGGIGKTQLARRFAALHQEEYSAVFWLDGRSEDTLCLAIAEAAAHLPELQISASSRSFGLDGKADLKVVVQDVLLWLDRPENSRWLLIIDNVDRQYYPNCPDALAYDVRRYFPRLQHGAILITTRLAKLQMFGASEQLEKVDEGTSMEILQSWCTLSNDTTSAHTLLKELEGLPLAIAQAGAFIKHNGVDVKSYLKFYNEQFDKVQALRESDAEILDYDGRSVMTTWTVSYNAVFETNPGAARLLLFWSLLDNKDLWFGLFDGVRDHNWSIYAELESCFGPVVSNELDFIQAMKLLRNYCLIEPSQEGGSYNTHPVLHKWAYQFLHELALDLPFQALAVAVVGFAVPDHDHRKLALIQRRLLPHAYACLKYNTQNDRPMWICGPELDDSERRDHEHGYLDALGRLASLYADQGKLLEAEQMFLRTLQGKEELLGREHVTTLETVGNLALTYYFQDKLVEAEQMHLQAAQGIENALGRRHHLTLKISDNLACLYGKQGKFVDAEQMHLDALRGKEEVLGRKHPSTLGTVHNLAADLAGQDKFEEAEEAYLRALQGKEEVLGWEHPSTLNTANGLALLYVKQSKLVDAEQMYLRALQGREQPLGREHPSTLHTVNNLANLYRDQDKLLEAEQMYLRALQGYEDALGREDPSTLTVADNLANLYRDQGKHIEAEQMFLRALQGREQVLGLKHPSTLRTLQDLGCFYGAQERMAEAEVTLERAIQGYEETFTSHQLVTSQPWFLVNWYMAILRRRQGNFEAARQCYAVALSGYQNVFGPTHTDTVKLQNSLAHLERKERKKRMKRMRAKLYEGAAQSATSRMQSLLLEFRRLIK